MMPEQPAGSTKRRSGVGLSDLLAATAAGANRGTRRIALEPAAPDEATNDQSKPAQAGLPKPTKPHWPAPERRH
jgi:hypothetical protein